MWVRTRDWVAPWKKPNTPAALQAFGTPGIFKLLINGKPLDVTFGTEGAEWHWQDGGTVEIDTNPVQLRLHDLTGFEGQCDAILLCSDPKHLPPHDAAASWRRKLLGIPEAPEHKATYDLVVVGGGIAGVAASISAGRPVSFPRCPWAWDLTEKSFPGRKGEFASPAPAECGRCFAEGIQSPNRFISGLMLATENRDDGPMVTGFLDGIQELVLLAAARKDLNELTLQTRKSFLPFYAEKQTEFQKRAKEISQQPNLLTLEGRIAGSEYVEAAAQAVEQAVATLEDRAKDPTITDPQKAERELRIALGMNVFELTMALKPPEGLGNPGDNPEYNSADHWLNFTKGRAWGDLPSGEKGEWDSLVDRQRSTL